VAQGVQWIIHEELITAPYMNRLKNILLVPTEISCTTPPPKKVKTCRYSTLVLSSDKGIRIQRRVIKDRGDTRHKANSRLIKEKQSRALSKAQDHVESSLRISRVAGSKDQSFREKP
jgi:hypothetical protein